MSVTEIKNTIFTSSDKGFMKYVVRNFGTPQNTHTAMNSLAQLKKLDDNTIMYGIARTEQIETHYDHSKSLPSLLAILVLMFGIYKTVFSSWIVFLLGSLISVRLISIMMKERKKERCVRQQFILIVC